MRGRILVVEDDPDLRTLIVDVLEGDGYHVTPCSGGVQALGRLNRERFDLLLADIKMPRPSGIDLMNFVRTTGLDTEVILMTAYASVQTAVEAVRGGAFDYLVKPFLLQEFRERVQKAVQKRAARGRRPGMWSHADLTVDLGARRVWVAGQEIALTRHEFDLLACLFERQGCAVSREELLQEVWGDPDKQERSLDTVKACVSRLRRKIGDDARSPRHILNVWGVGYQLRD